MVRSWDPTSPQAKVRQAALLQHFILKGHPVTLADDSSFREFCKALDPKFHVPSEYL